MMFYGRAGTLKSWLVLDLAMSLAQGRPWVGYRSKQVPVLLLQGEQSKAQYRKRVLKVVNSMNGSRPAGFYIHSDLDMSLDTFQGQTMLLDDIRECAPGVVVVDCLYQFMDGVETSEADMKRFMKTLDGVRQNHGTAFIIVAHSRKSSTDPESSDLGLDELFGTSVISRWLDTLVKVTGVPEWESQPEVVELEFQKVKDAEAKAQGLRLRFNRAKARFSLA